MPTGIPKSGKRRRVGYTLKPGSPSEQTQRLLAALHDIEDRLAVERAKDKARSALVAFANKHDLSAADLRDVAKLIGAREKGDVPVVSHNIGKAKRAALGRKLRQAREAKGLSGLALVKLVGAKGTGSASQWERGMLPGLPKYRDGLIKHLELPKDFFAEAGPPGLRGSTRKAKANGAAHANAP